MINVSSDEEYNSASTSSDDDEEFVSPRRRGKKDKERESAPKFKKPKRVVNHKAIAKEGSKIPTAQDRKYGFKPVSKSNSSSPSKTPGKKRTFSTISSSLKGKSKSASVQRPSFSNMNRSPRKAKILAEERLQQQHAADEEYRTQAIIEEAEAREDRVKSIVNAANDVNGVRQCLRELSLTPAPSLPDAGKEAPVNMLADDVHNETTPAATTVNSEEKYGWTEWTRDRAIARECKLSATVENGSDEELDISEYRFVNGVILHRQRYQGNGSDGSSEDHSSARDACCPSRSERG